MDTKEKLEQLHSNASKGDPEAQYNLGLCYGYGEGVPVNLEKAKEWLLKADDQGHIGAKADLVFPPFMCSSEEKKERWCKLAQQGDLIAQYNLGFYYYCRAYPNPEYSNFDPVPQDSEKAVVWFHKAADRGHVNAQFYLGTCLFYGRGISKNKEEAKKWLSNAARQGSEAAQFYLLNFSKSDPGQMWEETTYNEYIDREITKSMELDGEDDEERGLQDRIDFFDKD